jgi:hypothetical protein
MMAASQEMAFLPAGSQSGIWHSCPPSCRARSLQDVALLRMYIKGNGVQIQDKDVVQWKDILLWVYQGGG